MENFKMTSVKKLFILLVGFFLISAMGFSQVTFTPDVQFTPSTVWESQPGEEGTFIIVPKEDGTVGVTVTANGFWTATIASGAGTISTGTTWTSSTWSEKIFVDFLVNLDTKLNVIKLEVNGFDGVTGIPFTGTYFIIQQNNAPYVKTFYLVDTKDKDGDGNSQEVYAGTADYWFRAGDAIKIRMEFSKPDVQFVNPFVPFLMLKDNTTTPTSTANSSTGVTVYKDLQGTTVAPVVSGVATGQFIEFTFVVPIGFQARNPELYIHGINNGGGFVAIKDGGVSDLFFTYADVTNDLLEDRYNVIVDGLPPSLTIGGTLLTNNGATGSLTLTTGEPGSSYFIVPNNPVTTITGNYETISNDLTAVANYANTTRLTKDVAGNSATFSTANMYVNQPLLGMSGANPGLYKAYAYDQVGNPSTNSLDISVTDGIAPTLTAFERINGFTALANGNYTYGATGIQIAATFTEDISTAIPSVNFLLSGSGAVYTYNVTHPVANSGLYTFNIVPTGTFNGASFDVDVPTNAFSDMAGNVGSAADGQITSPVYFDNVAPIPVVTSSDWVQYLETTNKSVIPITVTFGEEVVAGTFTSTDMTYTNCAATSTTITEVSKGVFTFNVTVAAPLTSDKLVTVNVVPGHGVGDRLGNSVATGATFTINYDGSMPLASMDIANDGVNFTTPTAMTNIVAPLQLVIDFGTQKVDFSDMTTKLVATGLQAYPSPSNSNLVEIDPVNFPDRYVASVFTFNLYPSVVGPGTDGGLVSIRIPANTIREGHPRLAQYAAAFTYTFVYDIDVPEPVITMSPSSLIPGTYSLSVTYDEPVTYLAAPAIGNILATVPVTVPPITTTITAAPANTPLVKTFVYTFTVAGAATGILTFEVNAGIARDPATNLSIVSPKFMIAYDGVQPTPTLSAVDALVVSVADGATGHNISKAPYTYTATFNEAVSDFTSADIGYAGGTISNFTTVSPTQYTFVFTPVTLDAVTSSVSIEVNKCTDASGNQNLISQSSITFDGTTFDVTGDYKRPVLTSGTFRALTTGLPVIASGGYTNQNAQVSITFDENVAIFGAGATVTYTPTIGTGTATLTAFTVTGTSAVASINGLAGVPTNGKVVFTVPVYSWNDTPAGNAYMGVYTFEYYFRGLPAQPNITVASVGSRDGVLNVYPTLYETKLTTMVVAIDFQSNMNTTSPANTFDVTTNDVSVAVAGGTIALTDVTKTAGGWNATNDVYTFTLTIADDVWGGINLTMPNNAILDVFGNNATDATIANGYALSINYDGVEPVVSNYWKENGECATNIYNGTADPYSVTISVSDNIPQQLSINSAQLSITGGSAYKSTASITYNGTATMSVDYTLNASNYQGLVTVDMLAGYATDRAGNVSLDPATAFIYTFDDISATPTMTVSGTNLGVSGYITANPITVVVNFGEAVTGVTTNNLLVYQTGTTPAATTNYASHSVALVAPTSTSVYTFNVTVNPTNLLEGVHATFSIDFVPAGTADLACNLPSDIASQTIKFDNRAPFVTITVPDPVSPIAPIYKDIDTKYTATTTHLVTNTTALTLRIDVNEAVTGFTSQDVIVAPYATRTAWRTIDAPEGIYEMDISITPLDIEGNIVQVISFANYFEDAAGWDNTTNPNFFPSTTVWDIEYDATRPQPTIMSTVADVETYRLTNLDPVPFTIDFGEPVASIGGAIGETFAKTDITVTCFNKLTNSWNNPFYLSGTSSLSTTLVEGVYSFNLDVAAAADQSYRIYIDIPANVASDDVKNGNYATQYVFDWDNTKPLPTITSLQVADVDLSTSISTVTGQANATKTNSLNFKVNFGRYMANDFISSDISVSASTATLTGSDLVNGLFTYNLPLTNSTHDGTIVMSIPVNAATDRAGNLSSASANYSFVFDGTAPLLTVTFPNLNAGTYYVNNSSLYSVTYNAAVSGQWKTFITSTYPSGTTTASTSANTTFAASTATTTVLSPSLGLVNGTIYTMNFVMEDMAGNQTTAIVNNVRYDNTAPTPTVWNPALTTTAPTASNAYRVGGQDIALRINFGEPVTGTFATSDIKLAPAGVFSAVSVTYDGNGWYTATLRSATYPTRTIINTTVDVISPTTSDLALNASNPSARFYLMYDTTNPIPTVTLAASNYTSPDPLDKTITNVNTLNVVVVWDKQVYAFTPTDVTVTKGASVIATPAFTAPIDAAGILYSFDVPVNGFEGIVKIDIAANVASDGTNWNYAHGWATNPSGVAFSIEVDHTAPISTIMPITLNSGLVVPMTGVHTSLNPIPVFINMGEKVYFWSDISITNAGMVTCPRPTTTASVGIYSTNITQLASAPYDFRNVGIEVPFNFAQDRAGNWTGMGDSETMIWWDTTKPVPTLKTEHNNGIVSGIQIPTSDVYPYRNDGTIRVWMDYLELAYLDRAKIRVTETILGGATTTKVVTILPPAGAQNYFFDFAPTYPNSTVMVVIDAQTLSATDDVRWGTPNIINTSATYSFTYDLVEPNATVQSVEDRTMATMNDNYHLYNIQTAGTATNGISMFLNFNEMMRIPQAFGNLYYTFDQSDITATIAVEQYAYKADGTQEPVTADVNTLAPNADAMNLTFQLKPSYFDGKIYVQLPQGVVQDYAVNWNNASNIFTIDYDGVYPRPSITFVDPAIQARWEAGRPLNFSQNPTKIKVDFHEQVIDFVDADIIVNNATIAYDATLSNSTLGYYIYDISASDVRVEVIIPDAVCQDLAGNTSSEGYLKFDFEGANPVPFFSATEVQPTTTVKGLNKYPDMSTTYAYYTNNPNVPVTVTFDEEVVGLTSDMIDVSAGTKSAWTYNQKQVFTSAAGFPEYRAVFTFNPGAAGTFSLDMDANDVTDINGNLSAASYPQPFEIIYDNVNPTPSIWTTESWMGTKYLTNNTEIIVTVDFYEMVVNKNAQNLPIDASAITVVNASKGTFAQVDGSDTRYTLVIYPNIVSNHGIVEVDVLAGAVRDLAGNLNNTYGIDIEYDGVAPVPTITSSVAFINTTMNTVVPPNTEIAGFTDEKTIAMTVTFNDIAGYSSEDVADLLASEIIVKIDGTMVTNSISGFANTSNGVYSFNVELSSMKEKEGLVTVEVPSNVVSDMAGNVNVLNDVFAFYFDDVDPVLVSITNTKLEEAVWMIDELGRPNARKAIYDANNKFHFEFSEFVKGFDASDITVTMEGQTIGGFTITVNPTNANGIWASKFDVSVSNLPNNSVASDDLVVISLKDGNDLILDLADNDPDVVDCATYKFVYDNTAPTISAVFTTLDNPGYMRNGEEWTNKNVTMIDTKFSEPVNNFNIHEIDITSSLSQGYYVISKLTPSVGEAQQYSFDLVAVNNPANQTGEKVTLTYPVNAYNNSIAYDRSGNPSTFAVFTINYDAKAPYASTIANNGMDIHTADGKGYVNKAPMAVTVTYVENVWHVGSNDLTITGTPTVIPVSPTDGGTVYNYDFTVTTEGLVEVTHTPGAVTDLAENASVASAAYFSVIYDKTPPTPVITVTSPNTIDPLYTYSGANYANTADNKLLAVVNFGSVAGFDAVRPGFDATKLTVAGVANTVTLKGNTDNRIFTFEVDITGNSDLNGMNVTFDVAAGAATDYAGNSCYAAAQVTVVFDNQVAKPTLTFADLDGCTNTTPVVVTVDFGEVVRELTPSMITVNTAVHPNATVSLVGPTTNAQTFAIQVGGLVSENWLDVQILANQVKDLAGNLNSATDKATIWYDVTKPDPTIFSELGMFINSDEMLARFSVDFGEKVSGFVVNDINLNFVTGTIDTYQTPATTWADGQSVYEFSLNVTEATTPMVEIEVVANAASDCASNPNIKATYTIYIDVVAPVATVVAVADTDAAAGYTNENPVKFEVTLSEYIQSDNLINDITVGGASSFSIEYLEEVVTTDWNATMNATDKFTVLVTPSATVVNPVSVTIGMGKIFDLAGNDNEVSATDNIIYDAVAPVPSVALVGLADLYVNASEAPVTVQVTFNEATQATTINNAKVIVTNGTAAYVSNNGNVYEYKVTPTTDGPVTVKVEAGFVKDLASNLSVASTNTVSFTYDSKVPVPTIALGADWTNPAGIKAILSPVPFVVTYNEPVTGFKEENITINGGSIVAYKATSATQYDISVTPLAKSGIVSLQILDKAGAIIDAAGNETTASNLYEFVYDGDAPKPLITMTQPSTTVSNPTITVSFVNIEGGTADAIKTDVPYNFAKEDVNVVLANGTIMNSKITDFVMNDLTGVATFKITSFDANTETDFTVTVPDRVCQDVAGNYSVMNSVTFRFDQKAPALLMSAVVAEGQVNAAGQPVAATGDLFEVKVSISEFANAGSTVNTTPAAAITNNSAGANVNAYAFNVRTTVSDGFLTITIPANTVVDAAGNGNVETTYKIYVDGTAPAPIVEIWTQGGVKLTEGALTNQPLTVVVNFGEHVRDFDIVNDATYVMLQTAKAGALMTGGEATGVYSFNVYDIVDGKFTVSIPAGIANDDVNRMNVASNVMFVNYDGTAPVPTLVAVLVPNKGEINLTVAFNEDVDDFVAGDVKVTNAAGTVIGSVTAFEEDAFSTGRKYTMTITGLTNYNGVVNVSVAADVCTDVAMNNNVAASAAYEFDSTGPAITIVKPTEATPINGTAVLEFVTDGTMVGNAILTVIAPDGTTLSGTVLDNNTVNKDVVTAELAKIIAGFATLKDGVYTFNLEGVDELGNKTVETLEVNIKNSVPVVTITSPAQGAIVDKTSSVTYTVSPIVAVAQPAVVELTVNGITYTTAIEVAANSGSGDVMLTTLNGYDKLVPGDAITIAVKLADAAGNVGVSIVNAMFGSDKLPEVFAPAQTVTNAPLQVAIAQSNVLGTIYLVKEGDATIFVASLEAALLVTNANGHKEVAKVEVTAPQTDMFISTEKLEPGIYYAYAVDATGRISVNRSNPITVNEGVLPVGDFEFVTSYGAIYIQSSLPNGGLVSWDLGDGTLIPATTNDANPTHIYTKVGTYKVTMTVTDNLGNNEYTKWYDIVIDVVNSATDMFANIDVNVYPNPSTGKFTLTYSNVLEVEAANVTIMDIRGRVVANNQVTVNGNEFAKDYDLSMFGKGVYLVKVQVNEQVQVKRLVIE